MVKISEDQLLKGLLKELSSSWKPHESHESKLFEDLLWKGRLTVVDGQGAGIETRWVKLGYAVDQVEAEPGQRDLRAGDVILWVNGVHLMGALEAKYKATFLASHDL